MYHTIAFNHDLTVDLEISPKHRLERLRIRPGSRLIAQVRPYVVESPHGPVKVADLFFADGTTTRRVSCEFFSFTH